MKKKLLSKSFKPILEKILKDFVERFLKGGEAEVELTGLKISVGKLEILFEGKTRLRVRVK